MSYILEAIKKADHKRKIGSVPDIHSDHDANLNEPTHRPMWPYLLAIVLFFNAGLIAWWLKPWADTPPVPIEEQQAKIISPVAEKADRPTDPALTAPTAIVPLTTPQDPAFHEVTEQLQEPVMPLAVAPKPVPADNATATLPDIPSLKALPPVPKKSLPASTLSERLRDVAHSLSQKTAATKAIPTPGVQATPSPEPYPKITTNIIETPNPPLPTKKIISLTQEGDNSTPEVIQEDQLTSQVLDDNNTIGDTGEELDSNEDATTDEPGRAVFDINKIPFLYQLPESIQKKIPEITISFHSYRYRPNSRLVRINNHIMHEGQDISTELTLEKIVPSGVVLLFEHKRFRVGL